MDFIEQDCTITLQGKSFTSGGACIVGDRGAVYITKRITSKDGLSYQYRATTWHGKDIANAICSGEWRGRYGYRWRSYSLLIDGEWWHGRHCCDWADLLRIRKCKAQAS